MVSNADTTKVQELIDNNVVMVFSKSWCPFAAKTKQLLGQANVAYKVLELDQDANGNNLQAALQGISGQRTVPNVYIAKQHVGGNDNVQAAAASGALKQMLDAAGVDNSL